MKLERKGGSWSAVGSAPAIVTHVTVYDDGLGLPASREPEDVEAWLSAPEPDPFTVELRASRVLARGDVLTVRPGSLDISTS